MDALSWLQAIDPARPTSELDAKAPGVAVVKLAAIERPDGCPQLGTSSWGNWKTAACICTEMRLLRRRPKVLG
jgi:hypothetical protein